MMLKAWDEMTKLEQYRETYSDFYKDAYGIRPRHVDTSFWSLADFEHEFDQLAKICNENAELETRAQAEAVRKFEQHVIATIDMGAGDRETALRWIMQGSDANGDWDYFCDLNGLPYGYFHKVA
jgi:hypothetical protein